MAISKVYVKLNTGFQENVKIQRYPIRLLHIYNYNSCSSTTFSCRVVEQLDFLSLRTNRPVGIYNKSKSSLLFTINQRTINIFIVL